MSMVRKVSKLKQEYGPKWLWGKAERCDRTKKTQLRQSGEANVRQCVKDATPGTKYCDSCRANYARKNRGKVLE